jgi:outer membrane protein assembly factor BamD
MKHYIYIILISLLLAGCGKQAVSIGRGEPDMEIKKCTKLMDDKDFEQAVQCLEMFKARFSGTPMAQEAELAIGDAYFKKKEYLMAAESYLAYTKLYPTSPRNDYAFYRAGASYFKEAPKAIDRDQEYLEKAVQMYIIVVRRYSNSPYFDLAAKDLEEALARVAKRQFYIGRFYYRTGEYLACIPRFEDLVNNFPKSLLVEHSLYLITSASLKLGHVDDARTAFSKMSVEYPSGKWTKKAEKKMRKATK